MVNKIFPDHIPLSKRLFDLVLSCIGLIIISPIFLVVAILQFMIIGKPILFIQERPGYHGNIFKLYKFRTMINKKNEDGGLLPDSERITAFGRFLRTTSIDELPELLNVIRGEISLVGPRPLLIEYMDLYTAEQNKRHDVVPGITGWAQINGRNILSWEDKFKLDVWYVNNWSLWLDIKILFLTVWKVIKREGISQPGQATTEYFKGTDKENPKNT